MWTDTWNKILEASILTRHLEPINLLFLLYQHNFLHLDNIQLHSAQHTIFMTSKSRYNQKRDLYDFLKLDIILKQIFGFLKFDTVPASDTYRQVSCKCYYAWNADIVLILKWSCFIGLTKLTSML